jgi:hypothetical protein
MDIGPIIGLVIGLFMLWLDRRINGDPGKPGSPRRL